MKISVLIPAYNASRTLRQAIDSALAQSYSPFEIVVIDDGSTDGTYSIMQSYGAALKAFRQNNAGVAATRNTLCSLASGELIAFLDSDDIWHPGYLESQNRVAESHPEAVALFTGHMDFRDGTAFLWEKVPTPSEFMPITYSAIDFIRRYNSFPGPFANLSHLCMPVGVLPRLGPKPFQMRIGEDFYFMNRLALYSPGPVTYLPVALCAYRLRGDSISSDRLRWSKGEVEAMELLADEYALLADPDLQKLFLQAFDMKRRLHARLLMGANRVVEARGQLRRCLRKSPTVKSAGKSLALMALSYFPRPLQPSRRGVR